MRAIIVGTAVVVASVMGLVWGSFGPADRSFKDRLATADDGEVCMTIQLHIPDDQARALSLAWGGDLDRAALEALVIEGYRTGRLTSAEAGRVLGFTERSQINQWFADRDVPLNYTISDLEEDRRTLDRVLGKTA